MNAVLEDGSNVFDFVLVVLGIFGLSMSIAAYIQVALAVDMVL